MRHIKFLLLLVLAVAVGQAQAQRGELKLNLHYSYSMPLGDFKTEVISDGSARGMTGDLLFGVSNKVSVGLGLGFQDYYQKYSRTTYKTGDNEVTSAVLSNSVQIIPALLKAEVYPMGGKRAPVQPYLSIGAGMGITSFTQYLGEFGNTDNTAGLMLQGGAGVAIPFSSSGRAGLRLGANYNMVNYNKNGFGNLNSVNVQAGLYFPVQ